MAHPPIHCPWCLKTHPATLLCDAARQVLDATIARGRSYDVPTMEFDEPVYGDGLSVLGPDAVLLRQLTFTAATIEAAGVPRGAIIISGRNADNRPMPRWVYLGDDNELAAGAKIHTDVADMAIRAARTARGDTA